MFHFQEIKKILRNMYIRIVTHNEPLITLIFYNIIQIIQIINKLVIIYT